MENGFDPKNIITSQHQHEFLLPIYFPPPIKCQLPYSIISSIILANMRNWNWINNNFIQIWKESKDRQRIHFYPSQDFIYTDQSVLETIKLNSKILQIKSENLVEFLLDKLEKGYYIVIYLDEYYIPNARFYHVRHIFHSQFIFGYNTYIKVFKLMNFDSRINDLNIIDLGFDELKFAYTMSCQTDYSIFLFSTSLTTKKEKGYSFETDFEMINNQLFDFLYSKNSSINTSFFTGNIYGGWGLSIYDDLSENLLNLTEYIDTRGFYLINEHKKFMLYRFQYLFQNGLADNYEKELKDLILITEKIKMLCYKYNASKNRSILKKIISYLLILKYKEKIIYNTHLEKYYK